MLVTEPCKRVQQAQKGFPEEFYAEVAATEPASQSPRPPVKRLPHSAYPQQKP